MKFQQWDGTKWNVVTDWIAARPGPAAADHRGLVGQVRRGAAHHAARLRQPASPEQRRRDRVPAGPVPPVRQEPEGYDVQPGQAVAQRRRHRGHLQPGHPRPARGLARRWRPARSWRCSAPTGPGRRTTLKAVIQPAAAGARADRRAAGSCSTASPPPAARPTPGASAAWSRCSRAATASRSSPSRRTCVTGALARRAGRREVAADLERIYGYFPRLQGEAEAAAPAAPPAASSR